MALSYLTLALISSRGRTSPLLSAWRVATPCAPTFRCHFVYAKRTKASSVLAPMHIHELWVWERFPKLRPAMAMTSVPNSADNGDVPRASRWHDIHKVLDPGFAHAVFMTSKGFEWRPYRSNYWVCGHGEHDGDAAEATTMLSFARRLVVSRVGPVRTQCCLLCPLDGLARSH
jgi:hypothetical protein